jgi:NAD(P)-dependent dehydrogenase (short-subunit alcohol dehydrogenase family)
VDRLFATNFFGPVAMIKAVLPRMRAQRSGAIVNISSIGARFTSAGSGYYSATKAALEGLSGSLRQELQPLGISVMVVEPGAFRTDFAGRSLQQARAAIADYAETAGKRRKENDSSHGLQAGDPARAAGVIIEVVEAGNPPSLLLLGQDALDCFESVRSAQDAERDIWEDKSRSTAFTA